MPAAASVTVGPAACRRRGHLNRKLERDGRRSPAVAAPAATDCGGGGPATAAAGRRRAAATVTDGHGDRHSRLGLWPGPGRRQLWKLSSQNVLRFFCGLSEAAEGSRCNGCPIKSVSERLSEKIECLISNHLRVIERR